MTKYTVLFVLWLQLVSCKKTSIKDNEGRIVGGEPADIKHFPFNVQLFNMGGMCSGSILTTTTVLTAAHCFQFNTDPTQMQIFAGARYVYDTEASAHDISAIVTHEEFNKPYPFSNDIAIVLIADEFKYSSLVRKAQLANSPGWMMDLKTRLIISGWGKTDYKQKAGKNTKFMKTYLHLLKREMCEKANNVVLQKDSVCLYGDSKRDACQGDSGSGVLYKNLIVALVSHGRGCAELPSMYTNVFFFRPWIQKTVDKLHKQHCRDVMSTNTNDHDYDD